MIEVTSCLHVAIVVKDIQRAIAFYTNVLGLQQVDRQLKYPGAWYQIGDFQIHLIEDPNYHPSQPIDLTVSTRNPHFALEIKDLAATQAQLLAANCPIKMSNSGRTALFTQDPDGNVIELTQVNRSGGVGG
jgi:catechol 2,3-dioxygenase-like lactoylglutathione lyase family enzyme